LGTPAPGFEKPWWYSGTTNDVNVAITLTGGSGTGIPSPTYIASGLVRSQIPNRFRNSATIGWDWDWNSALISHSRIGNAGFKWGNFYVYLQEDAWKPPICTGGDTDQAWTGSGQIGYGNSFEFGYDNFTWINPDPGQWLPVNKIPQTSTPQFPSVFAPPRGKYYGLTDEQNLFNRATFYLRIPCGRDFQMRLDYFTEGYLQDLIHDNLNDRLMRFEYPIDPSNPYNIGHGFPGMSLEGVLH